MTIHYSIQKELTPDTVHEAKSSVAALNEALAARFPQPDEIQLIVWVSDIHLHTESSYTQPFVYKTYTDYVDTRRQFKLAMHEIAALDPVPQLLIFGGDITDRGMPEEFQTFDRMLREALISIPTVPLFGNHDNMKSPIHPGIRSLWPDIRREGWPAIDDPDELYYSFTRFGLKFIVLDTLLLSSYRMSEKQRSWLESELSQTDQPTLVLCHRHFLQVGNWVDQVSIFEDREVWRLLDSCPHIVGFFSGHVHYPRLWRFHKKLYCTFPALAYGIGAGTGWGGIVMRGGEIADVFYKEIVGESHDFNAGATRMQTGKHVFMEAELFESHRLCAPGLFRPFRDRAEEHD